MTNWNLQGRVVAITGATGGLGSALAQRLVTEGARVALLDLSGSEAEQLAADLGDTSTAAGFEVDVRSQASVESAVTDAVHHFGQLDCVIANAGVAALGPLSVLDPEVFDRVIDINLNGVWRTFRAALPHVEKQKGYLLATSSMAAFIHSPLHGPYAASKAGVWALCDSVRVEVRHLGVGVGSIHPTFFPTPMMEAAHEDPAGLVLWDGNAGGLFSMVSKEAVVDEVVAGMVRRRDTIVVPRRLVGVARAPGLVRRFVDRVGFPAHRVRRAIDLANPTGLPLESGTDTDPAGHS
jgi:NAD(P)-dependent dehydrogenase (short-subunit alcohol dehydrogenase family)